MSLMKTKPKWAPTAVPTSRGWSDPKTNEVYVAIGNLKSLLEAEGVNMNEFEPKVVKERKKREKKIVAEVTEVTLEPTQQIIGEVVENTDLNILGE